ncbi:MAG: aldo/keto reductase [Anaerolineae bacterium]
MEYATLRSGAQMPLVGLGTWTLKGAAATDAVTMALALGYRHIDTAEVYENQRAIADGIRESGVSREDLFLVSKVPREHLRYEEVLACARQTLRDLRTDYLDLYLIHWPSPTVPIRETLTALEELRLKGAIRAIGVSNFTPDHLREALAAGVAPIENDQVPYHPHANQEPLRKLCEQEQVVVTAYSPLGRGDLIRNVELQDLAEARGRTVAQLVLRWLVDKGVVVIPRSGSVQHLRDNLEIFGWTLDDEARQALDAMGVAAAV